LSIILLCLIIKRALITQKLNEKNIKAKITPGETVSFYRKMHKMTQKEPGEKLGNFSKQNVSEMERNIRPISKKTAKQLSDLFNISIDRLL
jgi:DNA-binding XRE family transcriptional regulator